MNTHIKYINDMAEKALLVIGSKVLPVAVNEIAGKFNLKVVEFDFPDSFSGVLKRERGVIGVNKKHALVRQRFTIAHELGHFVLGHSIGNTDDVMDDSFDKPIHNEKEANIFASAILMPEKWLKEEIKGRPLDLKSLASSFCVSEQALTIRLLQLNLIK